ncbi:MAG TPA: prephenate dehydrogenase/arogenate dehydrogenase family protein [Thermoleophilaceae bacterium]|nr:prephenate dehydrogenase/arogenate dehydrogenase family protein [Thermoleophilaceae bacterium]
MRIAVLGVGLIGGSIGLAARQRLDDVEVVGFGRDEGRLDRARALGALDHVTTDLRDALAGAQVCFACAPVGVLPELVHQTLAAAPADCVVTDVGSTKRRIVEAVGDERFVGGHPIAGAETAGVDNARADLFQGATWYLTPGERSSGLLYERLYRLVVEMGARPIAIDAETHDRLLATVSHLPHVIANVLVAQAARTLDEQGEALPRVGPSFRDATRVAGANSEVWTDIYLANADAIADEAEELARRLGVVAESLRSGDPEALRTWNEDAREDRRRLLEADLAGGPVHELHVPVPNRPGVVARLAVALGRAGVNIVDMALAPAPDMRTGAITLWVAGDEAATRAREVVDALDFGEEDAG